MTNQSGTERIDKLSRAQKVKDLQAAEVALQQQLDAKRKQQQKDKKTQQEAHKREEEQKKKQADEETARRAAEAVEGATVSPGEPISVDNPEDASSRPINLFAIMHGDESIPEDGKTRSPPKNKPKKASSTAKAQEVAPKLILKSSLKSSFEEKYLHKFQRVLVEAPIELKSDNPKQEFVANLQELLKNGQMVDKSFVFCPVKSNSGEKKIHDYTKIPTNMTLISGHFKISSVKKKPFEKQKEWKNGKEVKGELRNPTIYLSVVIASDKEPEELIVRICHEWHRRGVNLLKIKELQSF